MLQFTGEKMSKSVGNVETIRDVLDEWGRETALLFFLTAHWRKPIDFSHETMAAARAQWNDFVAALYDRPDERSAADWGVFADALEDDFNTPEALAVLHDWRSAGQLDLMQRGSTSSGSQVERIEPSDDVRALKNLRDTARRLGNFKAADEHRATIEQRGWTLRDRTDDSVLVPKL